MRLADGDRVHPIRIVLLQLHVGFAMAWLVAALLLALVAGSSLQQVVSPWGFDVVIRRRAGLVTVAWAAYALCLATGVYLLCRQAIYDPPLSGSDWSSLRHEPYGTPYYYAMYAKIGLFVLMGLATLAITRASRESHPGLEFDADGDEPPELDGDAWTDLTPLGGSATALLEAPTSAIARRTLVRGVPDWGPVGAILLGMVGVGVCVTFIKYFHELSRSAVVYQRLRGR